MSYHEPRPESALTEFELDNLDTDNFETTSESAKDENVGIVLDPFEPPIQSSGEMTFLQGLGLVVGLEIGSGIFASPNQIYLRSGSIGASMLVWLISGMLAWSGASSYAELGSAIPRNGGTQAYLSFVFGDMTSFLYTWVSVLVLKPGSAAIISVVFGEYLSRSFMDQPTELVKRLLAIALIFTVTAIQSFGANMAARLGTFFLIVKFTLLGIIAVVGVLKLASVPSPLPLLYEPSWWTGTTWKGMAPALYGGLWAYDGWDNLNYVCAEMREPQRDLPRVINTAIPTVICAYLIANLSYCAVLDSTALAQSTSVCVTLMGHAFSGVSARIMVILVEIGVALSCVGALNASAYSGGRLIQAAAARDIIPGKFLAHESKKFNTPMAALWLQAALACAHSISGKFQNLVEMYGCANYIFYLLAVVGLIRLRWTHSNLVRPYKTWITTPLLFCGTAVFLVTTSFIQNPVSAALVAGLIATGAVVYLLKQRFL